MQTRFPSTNRLKHEYPEFDKIMTNPLDVAKNQDALEALLEKRGIGLFIATSQDRFLSEYNDLCNHHRAALSGFTGSTGDGIFVTTQLAKRLGLSARFLLFVDGRYHLQADRETDPKLVQIMKLSLTQTIPDSLLAWVEKAADLGMSLSLDPKRCTWNLFEPLLALSETKHVTIHLLASEEINPLLQLSGWSTDRPIQELNKTATGRSLGENIQNVALATPGLPQDATCFVTCTSDDAAWLLNARGFHMPRDSGVLGYTFTIGSDILLFLPEESAKAPVLINAEVSTSASTGYKLTVIRKDEAALVAALSRFPNIQWIAFHERTMNAHLPRLCQSVWPNAQIEKRCTAIEALRARKTPAELSAIRDAFMKSSSAIATTLRWLKAGTTRDDETLAPDNSRSEFTALSECDLAEKIKGEYGKLGAVELSFKTIAAAGPHGAVVHYSTPDPTKYFAAGDLALLDSGAYYEEGFATDCTRVVFCRGQGATPQPWQKEIYTIALKACLKGMRAVLPSATPCRDVDALVREVCLSRGYDYSHGTGHGIGIHVHEPGIRFAKLTPYDLVEHAVVSIEPGIYLENQGGVRIENVVVVKAAKNQPGHFCFENLVFVGYDWDLIEVSMLDAEELDSLKDYELECQRLGTQVTVCPLT